MSFFDKLDLDPPADEAEQAADRALRAAAEFEAAMTGLVDTEHLRAAFQRILDVARAVVEAAAQQGNTDYDAMGAIGRVAGVAVEEAIIRDAGAELDMRETVETSNPMVPDMLRAATAAGVWIEPDQRAVSLSMPADDIRV